MTKQDTTLATTEMGLGEVGPVRECHSDCVGVLRAAGQHRLVAIRDINAGARLFRIEGEAAPRASRHTIQIGENLHLGLGREHSPEEILDRYFWRFMNHSCDPNTRISVREVIALRAIAPWEDVTFDYNTTEYDLAEPFVCHCGRPRCLGKIRGFKHLTASERERLRPFLAPHLSRLLCRKTLSGAEAVPA